MLWLIALNVMAKVVTLKKVHVQDVPAMAQYEAIAGIAKVMESVHLAMAAEIKLLICRMAERKHMNAQFVMEQENAPGAKVLVIRNEIAGDVMVLEKKLELLHVIINVEPTILKKTSSLHCRKVQLFFRVVSSSLKIYFIPLYSLTGLSRHKFHGKTSL